MKRIILATIALTIISGNALAQDKVKVVKKANTTVIQRADTTVSKLEKVQKATCSEVRKCDKAKTCVKTNNLITKRTKVNAGKVKAGKSLKSGNFQKLNDKPVKLEPIKKD